MHTRKRQRSAAAFAATSGLALQRRLGAFAGGSQCSPRRPRPVACAAAGASPAVPGAPEVAYSQAQDAIARALDAGRTRLFVEIDATGGDETYTMLKNSVPVARGVVPALQRRGDGQRRVSVLLPDSGAAALLARDWAAAIGGTGAVPDGIAVAGLDGARVGPDVDDAVMIVVPRASDVDRMERVVADADTLPVVVVNPDLVDMGVTGLSLNARQLRQRFIDTFEPAYYLKVLPQGLVLRAYPGPWALWRSEPGAPSGFALAAELEQRPSADDIDKAFDGGEEDGAQGPFEGFLSGLSRFLKVYTKG